MNAAPDRTPLMRQQEAEKAKRLKRAVEDVMACGLTLDQARVNRNVPQGLLRDALAAAGWQSRVKNKPEPRAKQLPQRRGDNQS